MLFNIQQVPFSRAGRFLTLSMMAGGLYLRSVRGGDLRLGLGRLCRISFADAAGMVVPDFTLSPDCLRADAPGGFVEFAIGAGETLHLQGQGLAVQFALEGSRYDYAYRTPAGDDCLVVADENTRLIPRATRGQLSVSGQWRRDHAENVSFGFAGRDGFEATVDLFPATAPAPATQDFAAARHAAAAEFTAWLAKVPQTGRDDAARRLAAYVLWANTVPPEGQLTRPAIFMSKNHMINIWSWDNAFSALGVVAMDAGLAFDQFAAIFDQQHPSGLLPDFVNDRDVSFAFTKPPVHGWAVSCIAAAHPDFLTPERRDYLRHHIGLQVGYWLTHARADAQSLPAYCHGNDSGWDNASFFAQGGPVLSPDLATFLILACDMLAVLNADQSAEAARWRAAGNALHTLLLTRLWSGESFGTRRTTAPQELHLGQSLIQFMPLLLGTRLPRDIADKLVERLQTGGFLTDWGAATESPQSPLYEPDGYWRGPIWAPTTYLLWDGLRRQGYTALATTIAARFCALCETSGMAENFDALSGQGLRDHGFAWTAAVYLCVAASLDGGGPAKGTAQ